MGHLSALRLGGSRKSCARRGVAGSERVGLMITVVIDLQLLSPHFSAFYLIYLLFKNKITYNLAISLATFLLAPRGAGSVTLTIL
jgi:hypothetical protein